MAASFMRPRFVLAPVPTTKVEIFSEFLIMLILLSTPTSLLKLMLCIFVLIAIITDVRSVGPPFAIAAEFVVIPIMFVVILSEFALIAMTTEVRSVEPPPAPDAIAAEFAAMTIIFSVILSEFALMLCMFAIMVIEFTAVLYMFAAILSEFALMLIMLALTIASIAEISSAFELVFIFNALNSC